MPFKWPVRFATFVSISSLLVLPTYAEQIAYKGGNHNGAFLKASKVDAQGTGVIVTIELECKKNWGGSSSGAAYVQMVGVETGEYQEKQITCSVNGGADGATKSKTEKQGVFFKGAQTVVIVSSMEHKDRSNWQDWQASIENTVKGTIDNVIKGSTDPKTILDAAKSAGFAGALL